MKRIIAIIVLLAMCVTLCSCGKDDSIKLTMDNYTDYLVVNPTISNFGDSVKIKLYDYEYTDYLGDSLGYYFEGIEINLYVEGASQNFVYNNVVLEGHFIMTYDNAPEYIFDLVEVAGNNKTKEFDLEVKTNVAGNGSSYEIIYADYDTYTSKDSCNVEFTVTDVSGSVSPVK